jgi:predicted RNA polymerase sigma factor
MPTHVEETDWADRRVVRRAAPVRRHRSPVNRAVAVGEADGAPAGLAALAGVDEHVPRREAVAAYLHERNGDLELAALLYADAARNAPNLAERDHQMRQAARLNQQLQHHG